MKSLVRDGRSPDAVSDAVARLEAGGLVIMPTETVYGLGADILVPEAVDRVFAVKSRPRSHPLIVHIADASQIDCWSRETPDYARAIADRFWPGPLTLILTKSVAVPGTVTGGQPTVALRVPRHPVAQALLSAHGGGVAAPSANTFGAVSPTEATHALSDLGPRLDSDRDLILDGGSCEVGLESTIVDCTGSAPRILRKGQIGARDLASLGLEVAGTESDSQIPRAPGSLASHYAPRARVTLWTEDRVANHGNSESHRRANSRTAPATRADGNSNDQLRDPTGLIAPKSVITPDGWHRLLAPTTMSAYAHDLYGALREADELGLATVVAVPPEPAPSATSTDSALAGAIADRLTRAAASH